MAYMEAEGLTRYFLRRKRYGRRDSPLVRSGTGNGEGPGSRQLSGGGRGAGGLIGPNGAGKSTTVKLLTASSRPRRAPAAGRDGYPGRSEAACPELGVVFGQRTQLWWDVPIADSFDLLREIYDRPRNDWAERLKQISAALELDPLLRTPLRQLSLGQRMRAEVCGSLLHRPRLLFLDEPTIGLDAVSKLALRVSSRRKTAGGYHHPAHHPRYEDMLALCTAVMVLGHGSCSTTARSRSCSAGTIRCIPCAAPLPGRSPRRPFRRGCVLRRDGDAIEVDYPPPGWPTGTCWTGSAGREPCGR